MGEIEEGEGGIGVRGADKGGAGAKRRRRRKRELEKPGKGIPKFRAEVVPVCLPTAPLSPPMRGLVVASGKATGEASW